MDDVIFVVISQDFAYQSPIVKILYAGESAAKAYEKFNAEVAKNNERCRITLDLVDGSFNKRLETYSPDKAKKSI